MVTHDLPDPGGITGWRSKISISTIRRADSDDIAAVRAAAVRFCDRHGIRYNGPDEAEQEIEIEIGAEWHSLSGTFTFERPHLRKLWAACYCRALKIPTSVRATIAYGHVGLRVE